MSLTVLQSELERVENELKACFETGGGYENQKALEAELQEIRDKIFHAEIKRMQEQETELEFQIEAELKLAGDMQELMANLASEIDEKSEELYYMRETHAGWSAQKYVAETNARNARSAIRDLIKHRSIKVSERMADNKKARGQ